MYICINFNENTISNQHVKTHRYQVDLDLDTLLSAPVCWQRLASEAVTTVGACTLGVRLEVRGPATDLLRPGPGLHLSVHLAADTSSCVDTPAGAEMLVDMCR